MRVFLEKLPERPMKQKRYTPEQIITILREVEEGSGEACIGPRVVLAASGLSVFWVAPLNLPV